MKKIVQHQLLIVFTGYHESDVKTAVDTIRENSEVFGITVNGNPKKEKGLIHYQPNLRGCDKKDLSVYSLTISGALTDVRNLIKIKTPSGVQIDLLPHSA